MAGPWWQSAVVYQIYPRSFADGSLAGGSGDGVGDLAGVLAHLDHVAWLGVDAIWLSPFYRSPMADAGYDVSDHCDVDPLFGTLADADRLIAAAHARGLRVLLDWIPNHTSDRHPWFAESRSSRSAARRSWYYWRDEPNNWVAAFGSGSAWTLDPATGQRYLHLFLPAQPDLDWREPAVVAAMHDVLRFWLDRGVDGFRIDAIHCVGKDPTFADDPRCAAGRPLSDFNDQPATHDVLRGVRRVLDGYPGDRLAVGEVNLRDTDAVLRYYGVGDELHLSFNFRLLDAAWDAAAFGSVIDEVGSRFGAAGRWPTWVLSNHDNRRHRTRYGGSEARARAVAVLLLSLRGTPFLYQGEELGLEDAVIGPGEAVDPGGRDGCRAPIPWEEAAPHGWTGGPTWLPFPPDAGDRSVAASRADRGSILHLYRDVLAVRRTSDALRSGTQEAVAAPDGVVAFRRSAGADERLVAVNFAASPRPFAAGVGWRVAVSSVAPDTPPRFGGVLGPVEAVILEPPAVTAGPWQAAVVPGPSSIAAASTLAGLAVLHAVWGLGLPVPAVDPDVLTDAVIGSRRPPPPAACFAVAGALGTAAALVAGVPRSRPGIRRTGQVGVAAVLLGRGLLGVAGRTDLVVPGASSPRFRTWDRRLYAPLCLALSAAAAGAALSTGAAGAVR